MNETIEKELNRLLPASGIKTIHGKFYMRFELGGGNKDRLSRIEQATKRGTEIYRQLIGDDEVIIAIEEYESHSLESNDQNKKSIYEIIGDSQLKRIKGPFDQTFYEENSEGNKIEKILSKQKGCDLLITKTTISIAKVKSIIRAIASFEMDEQPSVPQDVYFFSIEKQAGFRIYDDRGCDIWAMSIETLRSIYKELNAWILDYNRPKIDAMFENSTKIEP